MPISESVYIQDFANIYNKDPQSVVFFVGAGLSRPLFPEWSELLHQMLDRAEKLEKLNGNYAEFKQYLENKEYFEEIANECVQALGETEYRTIIESIIDIEFELSEIPEAYQKLLDMEFKCLLTTNYDRIPEVGSRGDLSSYHHLNAAEASSALSRNRKIVFKLHGDINQQESIILTESDFNRCLMENSAANQFLENVFQNHTVFFLGYGLQDRDIELLLTKLKWNNKYSRPHYALLHEPNTLLINKLKRTYNVNVIKYDSPKGDHIEVLEFLTNLSGNQKKNLSDVL